MANFVSALRNELLDGENNVSITENGAVGYMTTGKELLDLNFAVASLRSASGEEILRRFTAAFNVDRVLAVKWLFFARDVRGGLGERRLFREAFSVVTEYCRDEVIQRLITLIPEYGRYDDLWMLLDDEHCKKFVVDYVRACLAKDKLGVNNGESISLLAKWMPSCNASSKETARYARILRTGLGMKEQEYRKMLSKLRKHLDVVEVKMSGKKWNKINYEAVPSRANIVYAKAFLKNDEKRRKEFLGKLEKGEAKINSSVLFPHDIVHKYTGENGWYCSVLPYDAALEAMWRGLPDTVNGCGNTIVVADGSGSMTCKVGKSGVSALDVANALAIYFAEHSSGEFKDKYITFSENPEFVDFGGVGSLHDKIKIALAHDECANTNIEAVFDLILKTAVRNHMRQEDIPANVLIISDMEFDDCAVGSRDGYSSYWGKRRADEGLFNTIERKYRREGYELPRLVFWNVNSRTGTIPVRNNKLGVALVSGFSVNVCKMVMSGKLDPYECLLEMLNTERYKPVEEAMAS